MCVAGLLACKPDARGRCFQQSDCKANTYCVVGATNDGVCVSEAGPCDRQCVASEICVGGTCVARLPSLVVSLPAGVTVLSPTTAQVNVDLTIAQTLTPLSITVSASVGSSVLATGTLATVAAGRNVVTLSSFATDALGNASVVATLAYDDGISTHQQGSPAIGALVDASGPVFKQLLQNPNAYVARDASTVEVDAQLDDGIGVGVASASLTLATCPTGNPCSYIGTIDATGLAKFAVPTSVQQSGSEQPVLYSVTATDKLGNARSATGSLLIDDAGPSAGPLTLVTSGFAGEDGQTWFAGGATAQPVTVNVPVSDPSGIDTATPPIATLYAPDVSVSPAPAASASYVNGGAAVQVIVPASAVTQREGKLRFTLTTQDRLGHQSTTAPDQEYILVDALPPTVMASVADYTSPAKLSPSGCLSSSAPYQCGRTAASILRDDKATIRFDVYDCGSGVAANVNPRPVTMSSGGTSTTTTAVPDSPATATDAPCGSGTLHHTHHYIYTFDAAVNAAQLGDVSAANNAALATAGATGVDITGNVGTNQTGTVAITPVRWTYKAAGITGAPALLPGTGLRTVVVPASGAVLELSPDGSLTSSMTIAKGVSASAAVGSDGSVYVVSGDNGPCNVSGNAYQHCGTLSIVSPAGLVSSCTQFGGAGFGASPALLPNKLVLVAATVRDSGGSQSNVFLYDTSTSPCSLPNMLTTATSAGEAKAIAAYASSAPAAVVSHGGGFTTYPLDLTNRKFTNNQGNSFSPATAATSAATIVDASPVSIFFVGPSGTQSHLYDAVSTTTLTGAISCSPLNSPCWEDQWSTTAAPVASTLAPVFDTAAVYTSDSQGTIAAWSRADGSLIGSVAPVAGTAESAPVLLQGSSALAVDASGGVHLVTLSSTVQASRTVAYVAPSTTPYTPVLDVRNVGATPAAVAYVVDGQGVTAVHLNGTPLQAMTMPSGVTWPRPGRDTCNSRYSGSSCN